MGGVTIGIASRELQVSPSTILRWAEKGLLTVYRSGGNWRLFDPLELRKLAIKRRESARK